jgi:hypothetical protein
MAMTHEQFLQNFQMMQQLYSDQFMQQMQLFQQMNGHLLAGVPPMGANVPPTMPTVTVAAERPPVDRQAAMNAPPLVVPQPAPAPAPQPQAAAAARQEVPRMNAGAAGGAVEEDDEDINRDWLDYIYWISRAVVLFSIVYFYSSFSRFILVVILAITMYLYQAGWLFPRDGDNGEQPQRNNQPAAPAAAAAPEAARVQPVVADEAADDSEQRRRELPTTETERFSGLRLFWVIVSSLFTSLIPDQIPQNI